MTNGWYMASLTLWVCIQAMAGIQIPGALQLVSELLVSFIQGLPCVWLWSQSRIPRIHRVTIGYLSLCEDVPGNAFGISKDFFFLVCYYCFELYFGVLWSLIDCPWYFGCGAEDAGVLGHVLQGRSQPRRLVRGPIR
jgi:hypothetical protein